jgi:two-component system phosphate regulon sensor histidine kinase PhoR
MDNWHDYWPFLVFAAALVVVLAQTLWAQRRVRRERQLARQEYTEALLQKQQVVIAEAQAQMETLFNSMSEGVLIVGPDGRVQLFNQSLRQLLQFEGDLRGQTILEALRSHELDNLVKRLLKERAVLSTDLELGGTKPRYAHINASAVIDKTGQQRGVMLVFHDQTRLRQLENTRKEFVANVSHELRTPLTLIKGYVETLLNGAKDDPSVAARFLMTIDKHADRLTFLIEDLLTISRLESGQVSINLQPTPLREVAARVVEDLAARAVERQITLVNQVPVDLQASADGDRLQQVFFNLVDNAIKYGRPAGLVTVQAVRGSGKFIQVCVRDDGPGIPAEARDRVFERFYLVDKARSRDQGGTGLGLAIVKHIITAHGGKVWAENRPDAETRFIFVLPS